MDQTLNTRLNLYECAVVGNNNNLTLDVVTNLQVCVESIPWVWSELLQTESNALLLLIEVEDNNIDLLVELNNLLRIVNAAPAEVADMDQTVNTLLELYKYTEVGEVANLCSVL